MQPSIWYGRLHFRVKGQFKETFEKISEKTGIPAKFRPKRRSNQQLGPLQWHIWCFDSDGSEVKGDNI
jgi:hypothetical protein